MENQEPRYAFNSIGLVLKQNVFFYFCWKWTYILHWKIAIRPPNQDLIFDETEKYICSPLAVQGLSQKGTTQACKLLPLSSCNLSG